mmetsp:Transcript_16610/g.35061  ORF Transcript_16610/g.35061 Transcript_16610/m.35061 type:complete len:219 (-) Transcript_16610:1011-1667(-)
MGLELLGLLGRGGLRGMPRLNEARTLRGHVGPQLICLMLQTLEAALYVVAKQPQGIRYHLDPRLDVLKVQGVPLGTLRDLANGALEHLSYLIQTACPAERIRKAPLHGQAGLLKSGPLEALRQCRVLLPIAKGPSHGLQLRAQVGLSLRDLSGGGLLAFLDQLRRQARCRQRLLGALQGLGVDLAHLLRRLGESLLLLRLSSPKLIQRFPEVVLTLMQ